jgi:LmbE family N-acetylglucosaminyl deacetylase
MNVLAIGAHPDDIELGCGATLLRHVAAGDRVMMLVMTQGERGPQLVDTRTSEQEQAARVIGASVLWGGLPDCEIRQEVETVALIDRVVRDAKAEVLYTHAPRDSHQDHVVTSACSNSAARRLSKVLYYQSPSTTHFDPSVFVEVSSTLERKLEAIRCHLSQVMHCELVDIDAIEAQARYWGFRARERRAEAFEAPRFLWEIPTRRPRREETAVREPHGLQMTSDRDLVG